MRKSVFSIIAPQTKLLTGILLIAVVMIAPVYNLVGFTYVSLLLLGYFLVSKPSLVIFKYMFLAGMLVFAPYLFLIVLNLHAALNWEELVSGPWSLFIRGWFSFCIAAIMVSTIEKNEIHMAIMKIPLPYMFSVIIIQIVQQSQMMIQETRQVITAIKLRIHQRKIVSLVWALISIPKIWLPRMIVKAERVTVAMEVRDYRYFNLHTLPTQRYSLVDYSILSLLVLFVGAAIGMQIYMYR